VTALTRLHREVESLAIIARAPSLRQAADLLHTSQPSLGRQMERLEREIGAVLVDRDSRGSRLTAAGRVFLAHAMKLCQDLDRAIEETRQIARSEEQALSIGYVEAIPPRLLSETALLLRNRGNGARLETEVGTVVGLVQRIRARDLHLVFVDARVEEPWLGVERLWEEPIVACVPTSHPCARLSQVAIAELACFPLVLLGTTRVGGDPIVGLLKRYNPSYVIAQSSDRAATVLQAAAAGLGIGVLPASAFQRIEGITAVPIEAQASEMYLGWRRDETDSAVSLLLECARDAVKTRPRHELLATGIHGTGSPQAVGGG